MKLHIIFITIFTFLTLSCKNYEKWHRTGVERGYFKKDTTIIDSVLKMTVTSHKDTTFNYSVDTIYLQDSTFVTKYYYNHHTHTNYLETKTLPQKFYTINRTKYVTVQKPIWEYFKIKWYYILILILILLFLGIERILRIYFRK